MADARKEAGLEAQSIKLVVARILYDTVVASRLVLRSHDGRMESALVIS